MRYDIAVPRRHWESDLLAPRRQALSGPMHRQAIAALGGYDIADMESIR